MIKLSRIPIKEMAPVFRKGWVVNVKNRRPVASPGITSGMLFKKNERMVGWLQNTFNADISLVGLNPASPYKIIKLLDLEHNYQTDDKGKAMHFFYFKLEIDAKDRSKEKILDALISDILNEFINVNKLGKGQEVSISANFEPKSISMVKVAIVFEGAHESY